MKDLSIIVPTINDAVATILCVQQHVLVCRDLDFEILIIDNGSTEEEFKKLENFMRLKVCGNVELYQHDKLGQAPSADYGINLAKGKYITIPDSHIFYDFQYFHHMINHLEHNPHIGIATSPYMSSSVGDFRTERLNGGQSWHVWKDNPFGKPPTGRSNYEDDSSLIPDSELWTYVLTKEWYLQVTGGLVGKTFETFGGASGFPRWLAYGTYLMGRKIGLYPKVSCYHLIYGRQRTGILNLANSNIVASYVLTGERYFEKLNRDWGQFPPEIFEEAKGIGNEAHEYIEKNRIISWDDFLAQF